MAVEGRAVGSASPARRASLSTLPSWLSTLGPAIVIVAVQQVLFPSTGAGGRYLWGLVVQGLTLGLLTALVALGMVLVHRANRIINFAQGDLGLVPAALAIDLILFSGLHYLLALAVGLAAALVVGAVVELAIIRRFFRSGRLLLTVATIGLAQLLAFASLMLPRLWGEDPINSRVEAPWGWRAEIAPLIFSSGHLVAWVLAPLAVVAVAAFLRFTHVGIAVRAAADRADRAALLGIPVGRLHTCVWAIAAVLSFLALFLQAGIVGISLGSPVGLSPRRRSRRRGRVVGSPSAPASTFWRLSLPYAHLRDASSVVATPRWLAEGAPRRSGVSHCHMGV